MRRISRSALVPHTAEQMFRLVDDIDSYPRFLPWCSGAEVHAREENKVRATLELKRGGIRKSFTTLNESVYGESISLALLGGPFKYLQGAWNFMALGDQGSKVSFDIEFEFENPVTDLLFSSFFEESCNSLVEAFTRRAAEVYDRES